MIGVVEIDENSEKIATAMNMKGTNFILICNYVLRIYVELLIGGKSCSVLSPLYISIFVVGYNKI